MQRQKLTTKDSLTPHLLSMTATPIPRTLALTIYGDLDLTLLDQMPTGRKPIITKIILPTERQNTYEDIRKEMKNGRQLYVICPRIDEPDPTKELAVMAKSVTLEAERLKQEVFPEYNIDILHSKMTTIEKEKVMAKFSKNQTQILVATSVVEVGVNVPNATMIIIDSEVEVRVNGVPTVVSSADVDYMDVATNQAFSIATSMIPFLNHDDANRALMGSNMQKQAVPCLRPEAPLVATGIEEQAARYTGRLVYSEEEGEVTYVDSKKIKVENSKGKEKEYNLIQFSRTNSFTVFHQRPTVSLGQKLRRSQPQHLILKHQRKTRS
jgi:hypothetical protein